MSAIDAPLAASESTRISRVLWGILTAFAVVLAVQGALYVLLGIDPALDSSDALFSLQFPSDVPGKSSIDAIDYDRQMFRAHPIAFYAHVIFAPLALVLGPLQLSSSLRGARPRLHRWTGRTYLAAQVLGIPAGMYLSLFELGGLTATMGFFGMGGTALACSAMALLCIARGDVVAHREWAVRSYAVLWSGAVLFRLLIFFVIPVVAQEPMPQGFRDPYVAFSFLSWAIGLLCADVYLSVARRRG